MQTITRNQSDRAKVALIGTFSRLDTVETQRKSSTSTVEIKGGQFATDASRAIIRSLTQAAVTGYVAVVDGFQIADFSLLPTLYPEVATLVSNAAGAQRELSELDFDDIVDIARELIDSAERVSKALAINDANARIEPVAMKGADALKAAQASLYSLRDITLLGLNTFKNGFDVTKLPALFQLFPQATSLAQNAPVAVNAYASLTLVEKAEVLKTAIDVVVAIITSLQKTA
jgi:hypothetical protein